MKQKKLQKKKDDVKPNVSKQKKQRTQDVVKKN
jgi:hypothetical protein